MGNNLGLVFETVEDENAARLHTALVEQADQVLVCPTCGCTTLYGGLLSVQMVRDYYSCPSCKGSMEIS